jgi:hypothetical protein
MRANALKSIKIDQWETRATFFDLNFVCTNHKKPKKLKFFAIFGPHTNKWGL